MTTALVTLVGAGAGFATTSDPFQTVVYSGASVRVPASWPVVNLDAAPDTCVRFDQHAVYLGTPGAHPACPARLFGRTETVWIQRLDPTSDDAKRATRTTQIASQPVRTDPDSSVTQTLVDVLDSTGAQVSISYGDDRDTARGIEASLQADGPSARGPLTRTDSTPAPPSPLNDQFSGGGFDACAAPDTGTMQAWLASPYRGVGVYIGGSQRACAQPNLTSAWLNTVRGQGWHVWPMYVGLQPPCVGQGGLGHIDPNNARAQGVQAADDAANIAQRLGFGSGTPLIYDMEHYNGCGATVTAFLDGYDAQLHARGYGAGLYESGSNFADVTNANITKPDAVDIAVWNGQATPGTSSTPASYAGHQIHQYQGGHNESYGGQTINIDNDQLDINL
ncbi:MAG: DUF1906 domain-containing protein [Kutzneria sp.]|nr:DUF1906 domain-containing protein [Kutzneria sp.]